MKHKRILFVLLLIILLIPVASYSQSASANKAWPAFWAKFRSAAIHKNKSAMIGLAIDDSRFERDEGGDSPNDFLDFWLGSRMYKQTVAEINSGVKPWKGGKITRKGCYWFKFIGGRWYWAGIPCD